MKLSDTPLRVALLVRDDGDRALIRTLEGALTFIRKHDVAEREGNRDATIFRLESARDSEQSALAENAFRAWIEAAGLLIEAQPPLRL